MRCFAARTLDSHDCHVRPDELDCAHLIPAQRLKNTILGLGQNPRMRGAPLFGVDLNYIVYHPDIAVPICREAHHSWDLMGKRCRREQLPERVEAFAHRYWITHLLDKLYGYREAKAA